MNDEHSSRRDERKLAAVRKAAKQLAAARAALDAAYLSAHLNGWSYRDLADASAEPLASVYRRINSHQTAARPQLARKTAGR